MNSRCGAFVVFRYEIDDSIIIEKSHLTKAFKTVYKDLEIPEDLLDKYLNVSWDIHIVDKPLVSHVFVLRDITRKYRRVIEENLYSNICFQRTASYELNKRYIAEWAQDEYRNVQVKDFILLDMIDKPVKRVL